MSKYNGMTNIGHPEKKVYSCWRNMINRCYRVTDTQYHDYGGRGITVCDEWLNSFMLFYNWAKVIGWEDGLQIDRININGNYEPSNCKFITQSENVAVGKRRKRSDTKSGFTGVSWNKTNVKWQSMITINKKQIFLGCYDTVKDALRARIDAEILYFGKQITNL